MNKQIIATLFIFLFIGNTFAFTCKDDGTAGPADGYYTSKAHTATDAGCSTSACLTGYTQNSDGTAAPGTLTADCDYCTTTYAWSSVPQTACILKSTGGLCADGYSDKAPTSTGNTAQTATGTATTGNCQYCAPNYIWSSAQKTTCVLKATGGLCLTGYSDKSPTTSNQDQTATGTAHVGDCKYCSSTYVYDSAVQNKCVLKATGGLCATGYSDKAPSAGANQDQTATGTAQTGDCKYCSSTYVFDSVLQNKCVLKATGGLCAAGYSDKAPTSSGNTAQTATGTAQTGDCKYCAVDFVWGSPSNSSCVSKAAGNCESGWTQSTPGTSNCDSCATGTYWTSTANTTCGTTCATGFQTATGTTTGAHCTKTVPTTSGNILTYSVLVILAIISLLF